MKYSCIPNGSKIIKMDILTLPSGATILINTGVISYLNQSTFSIFARFSMVRARVALSRLLFLTRAKNFKKLFIPIINVVKWKKKQHRNAFQIRGCY